MQHEELDMHQLIRDTPERQENVFEHGSAREAREFRKTHNELIFLLLLRRKFMHMHIKSDLDISRSRHFFSELLQKLPSCHEAMFELGRVHFHTGAFNMAIEQFEAVRTCLF